MPIFASRLGALVRRSDCIGIRITSRLETPALSHFCVARHTAPRIALPARARWTGIAPYARNSHQAVYPPRRDEITPLSDASQSNALEMSVEQKIDILGEWQYGSSMGYAIRMNKSGECEFEEMDAQRGFHHRGVLRSHDEWLQGELANDAGQCIGAIRLRLDAEQHTVISQCKPVDGDWGPQLVAYPPDECRVLDNKSALETIRENAMPFFIMATLLCASIVMLSDFLRTASWRGTVRPLFAQLGLERYADQLEALWRENTEM